MAADRKPPVIRISELPGYAHPIALHGARLNDQPVMSATDDLWIIAVIVVYESGGG
ncbi:hypothetical protein [Blastomonas sp. AAP53]|uniref:hypothetical protein n=1 Tax=Blastomonas sp. AAP53 TaxID=1248760 RepID=UPI0002D62052|nr:hypothetical protein [Blastomonas sp. AAP53]